MAQSEPTDTEPPDAARDRRALPFGLVLACATGAVLIALCGVWLLYRRLIHYEPHAARHLLPGTEIAARLEVEQVVAFEPVRRHLLPLVNTPLSAAPAPDRLRDLRELGGLNLGRDLREIVIGRSGSGAWVIVLGGLFPEHGLVTAIEGVLRREGVQGLERIGETLVLAAGGMALGQARDGALVAASARDVLEDALRENDVYERLGMPREGDGSLVLGAEPLRRWLESAGMPDLRAASGLVATMRLGRPLRVEARLLGSDAEALSALLAWVQRSMDFGTHTPAAFPMTDSGAERAMVARARVGVDEQNFPIIETFIELPELDSALAWVAARLERGMRAATGGG